MQFKRTTSKTQSKLAHIQKAHERVIRKFHSMQEIELGAYGLTHRETDVAMYLLNGLANVRIASQLFITESTVKLHVSNIFRKCHVSSRQEFCWMFFCKVHAQPKETR